jgi:hypothetical protein
MTYKSHTALDKENNVKPTLYSLNLVLSDKVSINNRAVYDIITLVSEVSGFADLLIVSSTFLMSLSLF